MHTRSGNVSAAVARVLLVAALALALGAAGTEIAAAQTLDAVSQGAEGSQGTEGGEHGGDDGQTGEDVADRDPELDALLAEGAEVYSVVCSSCHQPGGVGLEGQYPPLVGNERALDPDYVALIIDAGRSGQLEVDGVLYDATMPSFATLPDDDVEAVVTYVTSGFASPSVPIIDEPTGEVAGTTLPILTTTAMTGAALTSLGLGGFLVAPMVTGRIDRTRLSWPRAWLKSAVIVVASVAAVAFIPDWALKTQAVSSLSRPMQDLVAVVLWGGGMLAVSWSLWYAHGDDRV